MVGKIADSRNLARRARRATRKAWAEALDALAELDREVTRILQGGPDILAQERMRRLGRTTREAPRGCTVPVQGARAYLRRVRRGEPPPPPTTLRPST